MFRIKDNVRLEIQLENVGNEIAARKVFFLAMMRTSLLKRFKTTEEVAAVVILVARAQTTATDGAAVRDEGSVIRSIF
ncbi:MAG: hypothetical protein WAN12_02275 [Candidatus Acidiferrum sp.]